MLQRSANCSLSFIPALALMALTTACQGDLKVISQRLWQPAIDQDAAATDPLQSPHLQFVQAATAPDSPLGDLTAATHSSATIAPQSTQSSILPPIDPLETYGDLVIAGSPELDDLNILMYQNFVQQGYADVISLNSIGSTAAIQILCERDGVDLLTITRTLTETETKSCQTNGVEPIAFAIGKDALVLVVNPNDTFVKEVNLEKLKKILTLERWSDVDPRWPDQQIERFLVGPDSGTINLLADKVFQGDHQALLQPPPNTNFYKYEEPIIQALSNRRYRVGVLSYPAYERVQNSLRTVAINQAMANPETAESGAYPLARTLFIYADQKHLRQTTAASTFINFYLTRINKEISIVSLFPLSDQALKQSEIQWLKVME